MGLNLDLGIYCLPKPLSEFLHRVSRIEDCPSILSEIHGFVDRLEEERRKIDAFKRELPLCMILLNEAIGRLREETRDDGSAREGSVASNRKFDDGGGAKVENDKKSWMRSAQLWISNSDSQLQLRNEEEVEEEDRSVSQNSFPSCIPPLMPPPPPPLPLTLTSSASDMVMNCRVDRSQLCKPSSQQPKKERRRRWSPELHRKFIDVLQNLGGSQVATPKQIRELMQVEGLTNDEVKSHLQKYRIHVRKHAILTAAEASRSKGSESGSISRSESPQGPLGGRGYSSNGGHSSNGEDDNEEAKSDGESCKNVCNGKERVHFQL